MTSKSNNPLDSVLSGAAADSATADGLSGLPRVLRYAILAARGVYNLKERVLAELAEIAPDVMGLAAKWIDYPYDSDHTHELAARLDHLAVAKDDANLRGLADAVRIASLPYPETSRQRLAAQRVAKAVLHAHGSSHTTIEGALLAEIERIVIGWASLSLYPDRQLMASLACHAVRRIGMDLVEGIEREAAGRASPLKTITARAATTSPANPAGDVDDNDDSTVPPGQLIVCRMDKELLKNQKVKEVVRGHEHAINAALPLTETPPLHEVRQKLLFEFPYAQSVIDFILADLVGRATVGLRPVIIWGPAGSGKTRFARRVVELLGVSAWRTDASRSDGAVFAGTDRRWYTAEPCHPFLAISRARHANPIVIIDEIEKAGTRSDYGRFWDCLLAFLDPETASYMDPALQVPVDLTHVSYIATANGLDSLPAPLRDRFRTIEFPEPRASDLDALLPPAIAAYASDRQMDARWIAPFAAWERDLIGQKWKGGSVRRLRRFVEAILRAREKTVQMH